MSDWPTGIAKCACCGRRAGDRRYRARGMCHGCWKRVRRREQAEGLDGRGLKRSHFSSMDLVRACCRYVGASGVASQLGQEHAVVLAWGRGKEAVPRKWRTKLAALIYDLARAETEARDAWTECGA